MPIGCPDLGAVAGKADEDLVSGLVPDEGFGVGVPFVDPGSDVDCELFGAVVAGALELPGVSRHGYPSLRRKSVT